LFFVVPDLVDFAFVERDKRAFNFDFRVLVVSKPCLIVCILGPGTGLEVFDAEMLQLYLIPVEQLIRIGRQELETLDLADLHRVNVLQVVVD